MRRILSTLLVGVLLLNVVLSSGAVSANPQSDIDDSNGGSGFQTLFHPALWDELASNRLSDVPINLDPGIPDLIVQGEPIRFENRPLLINDFGAEYRLYYPLMELVEAMHIGYARSEVDNECTLLFRPTEQQVFCSTSYHWGTVYPMEDPDGDWFTHLELGVRPHVVVIDDTEYIPDWVLWGFDYLPAPIQDNLGFARTRASQLIRQTGSLEAARQHRTWLEPVSSTQLDLTQPYDDWYWKVGLVTGLLTPTTPQEVTDHVIASLRDALEPQEVYDLVGYGMAVESAPEEDERLGLPSGTTLASMPASFPGAYIRYAYLTEKARAYGRPSQEDLEFLGSSIIFFALGAAFTPSDLEKIGELGEGYIDIMAERFGWVEQITLEDGTEVDVTYYNQWKRNNIHRNGPDRIYFAPSQSTERWLVFAPEAKATFGDKVTKRMVDPHSNTPLRPAISRLKSYTDPHIAEIGAGLERYLTEMDRLFERGEISEAEWRQATSESRIAVSKSGRPTRAVLQHATHNQTWIVSRYNGAIRTLGSIVRVIRGGARGDDE